MDRAYIVRKYIDSEETGVTYYEEGIFSTYETAYGFVREISEETCDKFLSEIVSYPLDSSSPWDDEETWIFDKTGKLLHSKSAKTDLEHCKIVQRDGYQEIYIEPEPESFTGKFKAGDIVFVRAFPWDKKSPVSSDVIGAVAATPQRYEDWIGQGRGKYEWDNDYIVYWISNGYLDHIHVEEASLELYTKTIPERLSFLELLSDHYKGKKVFKEGVIERIYRGDIFVEKVRYLNSDDLL